jgi:hypothetical protein
MQLSVDRDSSVVPYGTRNVPPSFPGTAVPRFPMPPLRG